MDNKCDTVELYTSQRDEVVELLKEQNEYFVKLKYIKEKYAEVSDIFLNAYEWYVGNASAIVERPSEAESGIWAFMDLRSVDKHEGSKILKLEVPKNEAVFFDMADWNKVLNMTYIGDPEEELAYKKKLEAQGIKFESDVVTTPYYPLLKRELYSSRLRLFRHHEKIRIGDYDAVRNVQAGLWCIKKSWVSDIM